MMKGRRFEGINEFKEAFEDVPSSKPPEVFREAFLKWRYCKENCIENNDDYVEKV